MNYTEQLLRQGRVDLQWRTETQVKSRIDQMISTTFAWMAWLLFISFGLAYGISTWVLPIPLNSTAMLLSTLWWFGLVILMSRKRQSMSYAVLATFLLWFAVLEWYWMAWVFLFYGLWLVYQAFLSSALLFWLLAVAWYYLKVDTSRVWNILFIWLIALILAFVVNMFIWSAEFSIWLAAIWIILFSALTIYDMNVMKQQALVDDNRLPLLMSLSLFLNFINIFQLILMLMWGRD